MDKQRTNPYLGPEFFTRDEEHLFFGRSKEIRDLVSIATTERVLLFYAPSGAGKSSLLNAKLIPRLEEKLYEVLPIGRVSGTAAVPPNAQNVYTLNLMMSLLSQEQHLERFIHLSLSDFLWHLSTEDGKHYFYDDSAQALRLSTPKEKLWPRVLILDQFEEIMTNYPTRWQDREAFFREINQALQSDPLLRVIMSLRSDFIQELDQFAGILDGRLRARYHMLPLNLKDAEAAIAEPARLFRRPFADGVARRLVDNMSQVREVDWEGQTLTQPGEWVEPIQLQVVCYQIWEQLTQIPGDNITLDHLKQLARTVLAAQIAADNTLKEDEDRLLSGLVDGALATFYESALGDALAASAERVDEAFLRNWFSTKLITEGGARSFLERGKDETAGVPQAMVKVLVDKHLLRSDMRGSIRLVELVHDRFVPPIREANRLWNEHRMQAQPWIATGFNWYQSGASPETRDASLLLKDADLELVLTQTAGQQFEPVIDEYLATSKTAQRQRDSDRKWRRTVMLAGGALILTIFVIGVALFAFYGWNKAIDLQKLAETAQAQTRSLLLANLAERSLTEGESDNVLALALYATEAIMGEASMPAKAELLLAQAIYRYPTQRVMPHGAPVYSAAINEAHDVALSGGADGSVVAWDLSAGQERWRRTTHTGTVWSVAISGDSRHGLSGGDDGQVIYWNLDNGEAISCITDNFGKVFSVAFDPQDDTRALFAGSDQMLHLWDLARCQSLLHLQGHTDWIYTAAFSPDGRQALSGSEDQSAILWDLEQGKLSRRLGGKESEAGHGDWVRAVAFSPDGKTGLTASREIIVWNLADGSVAKRLVTDSNTTIYGLAFDPDDSNRLLSASDKLALWDIDQGQVLQYLNGHTELVRAVVFGDHGGTALSGALDGNLRLWDLRIGLSVANFRGDDAVDPLIVGSVVPPQECGRSGADADYGPIAVGSTVLLGRHRAVDGNDIWNREMDRYVDKATIVTELKGSDSSSGCPIVSVEADGGEFVWRIRDMRLPGVSHVLALDPDRYLALSISGEDEQLTLWDPLSSRPLRVFEGHESVVAAAFADDGRIASAGEDGTLRLWMPNSASGDVRWSPAQVAGNAMTVTLPVVGLVAVTDTTGSLHVVAVTGSGRVIDWQPDDRGAELKTYELDLKQTISTTAIVAVDAILLGYVDGSMAWWDGANVREVKASEGSGKAGQAPAGSSQDRYRVLDLVRESESYRALVATDRGVQVLKLEPKEDISAVDIVVVQTMDRNAEAVFSARFSADGTSAVLWSSDRMQHWSFSSNQVEDILLSSAGPPAVFGDDGRMVYLGTQETGVISLRWAEDDGRQLAPRDLVPLHALPFSGLAVGPQHTIVSAAYSGTLALWDARDGQLVESFDAVRGPLYGLATSHDGHWAVAGTADGDVILWDLSARREEGRLSSVGSIHHTGAVLAMAVDMSGQRLLSSGMDGRVILWDRARSQASELRTGGDGVVTWSLALHPDGRQALLGLEDGGIELWDLDKTQLLRTLSGHTAAVHDVTFNPTGRLALSGSADKNMILWDIEEGEEIHRFPHPSVVAQVAFSPDNSRMDQLALSVGGDQTARLWQLLPPLDQLAAWMRSDQVRYIPKLGCITWREEYGLEPPKTADGRDDCLLDTEMETETVAAAQTATPAMVSVMTTQAKVGDVVRGEVPLGGKQRWQFEAIQGQWLSVRLIADRPAGDTPQEEISERGRLALSSTLRDPGGNTVDGARIQLLKAGNYELEVASADNSSAGGYTLTLATAVEISVGEDIIARLETGKRDLWWYAGHQGQQVRVDMRSSDFDTYLELWDSSGNILAENDDYENLNSRIEDFELPADGSYLLVGRGLGDATGGSYALSLKTIVPRTSDEISRETLAADIPITATISPGAAYAWTFPGLQANLVTVFATSLDDSTALTLTLLAPDRAVLQAGKADADGTVPFLPSVILPETGEYTLLARGREDGETAVRLSVESSEPERLLFDGTTPVTVQSAPHDPGVWSFDGRPGQIVNLALHNVPTGTLTLLDPSRHRLAESSSAGVSTTLTIDGVMLEQLGAYVVVANVKGALPYTLMVAGATSQPIAVGETVSGTLEGANTTQFWVFEGEGGQYVDTTMRSAEFDSYLKVYGPDGLLTEDDDSGGGPRGLDAQVGALRLSTSGRHTIAASALSGAGAYTLTLFTPTLPPIDFGDTVTGTLETSTFYTFAGHSGQLVRIDLTAHEDAPNLTVALSGPDGETLGWDDASGVGNNSMILAALPFDGVYTILPQVYAGYSGAFRLSLSEPFTVSLDLDSGLEQGVVAGKALSFEGRAGQVLRIMINAETVQSYLELVLVDPDGAILATHDSRQPGDDSMLLMAMIPRDGRYAILPHTDLDVIPVNIQSSSNEALTSAARNEIASESLLTMIEHDAFTSTLALLEWIEEDSEISLTVETLFGICKKWVSIGDAVNVFAVCKDLAARAPTIAPASPVTDTIDHASGDLWKLEVTAGSRITITLSVADDSNLDPYLTLYDAGFQLIAEDDDSGGGVDAAIYNVTLTEPGLYWIAAGRCCPDNDQGSVGAYVLEVTVKEEE